MSLAGGNRIERDVTAFDLNRIHPSDELAAVGEQATLQALPEIKQLLGHLVDY